MSKIILFFMLAYASTTFSENLTISQAKQSLNQLEVKIRVLQQRLSQTQDKQAFLKKELANTEQQIKNSEHEYQKTQSELTTKEKEISLLQQQIDEISTRIQSMRTILMKHIRARYKMQPHQPMSWIFRPDASHSVDRLLTYYQYVVRSDQNLMNELKAAQNTLTTKQETLRQDMAGLYRIQQQWQLNQKKLRDNKAYHAALIQKMNHDIQNQEQTLENYKLSQNNLTKLLTRLVQQSVLQTRHPMTQMKRKLIKPVNTSDIRRMNQGAIFYAAEGSPVYAVSPGKVVFCDWLNGYGRLMIIDHGWGFMTLYANNQALFKQKGEAVNQGDKIAIVGHSGTLRQNGLYFEIRHRGKATPPLEWLR